MYATTTVPAFDALGGVEAVQRLASPSVHISHIGWNDKDRILVAVLEGEDNSLSALRETLNRMNVHLEPVRTLTLALSKAKLIADVVEFEDVRKEDSYT